MIKRGYPAYTTSVGWLGYSDDKVRQLTKEALNQGFNHFKLKVGANVEDDLRRGRVIREIIDDPKNLPEWREKITPESVAGKNASAAGTVLMVDANQVWDVAQAIDYVKELKPLNPWCVSLQLLFDRYRPLIDSVLSPHSGSSRSPPRPTTSLATLRSARALSPTASVSPPASTRAFSLLHILLLIAH